MVLLQHDVSSKAALDCELCKTVLPMLRRTATRLSKSGVNIAWVNCTSDQDVCDDVGSSEEGDRADWGSLRLVWFGQGSLENTPPSGSRSLELWDSRLFLN